MERSRVALLYVTQVSTYSDSHIIADDIRRVISRLMYLILLGSRKGYTGMGQLSFSKLSVPTTNRKVSSRFDCREAYLSWRTPCTYIIRYRAQAVHYERRDPVRLVKGDAELLVGYEDQVAGVFVRAMFHVHALGEPHKAPRPKVTKARMVRST